MCIYISIFHQDIQHIYIHRSLTAAICTHALGGSYVWVLVPDPWCLQWVWRESRRFRSRGRPRREEAEQ